MGRVEIATKWTVKYYSNVIDITLPVVEIATKWTVKGEVAITPGERLSVEIATKWTVKVIAALIFSDSRNRRNSDKVDCKGNR